MGPKPVRCGSKSLAGEFLTNGDLVIPASGGGDSPLPGPACHLNWIGASLRVTVSRSTCLNGNHGSEQVRRKARVDV